MPSALTLLIVDDEALVVEMLQRYLQAKGYDVRGAGRVDEALAVYQTWRPALVLLDIRLPDGSGLALLRQIRALNRRAHVVVVTAAHELECRQEALAAGAAAFAFKPIEVTALDRILRAAAGVPPPAGDPAHPAVMVLDDEAEVRLSIKFYLIGHGLRVTDAATAEEALALLRSVQPTPQILVLDLALPKMSGIDFLKAVRQARPELCVVVLTGFPGLALREQAEQLGVQRFLRKPVSLQALEQTIREVAPHG
ncbi:MAG: response regulator [Candidatus Omnitrophica bacterium]|nr:response regulator [Candidatus Omnitrophota bacterium]